MSFPNILEVQPVALTQRGNALAGTRFFGLGRLGQDAMDVPASGDVEAMKSKVRTATIIMVSSTTALGAVGGAIGAGKGHRGGGALGAGLGALVGYFGGVLAAQAILT